MELVPDLLRRMLPYAPVATTIVLVIVGLLIGPGGVSLF